MRDGCQQCQVAEYIAAQINQSTLPARSPRLTTSIISLLIFMGAGKGLQSCPRNMAKSMWNRLPDTAAQRANGGYNNVANARFRLWPPLSSEAPTAARECGG